METLARDLAENRIQDPPISKRPLPFVNIQWKPWVAPAVELGVIAFWALWLTRDYLNFDPLVVPAGREFLSAIQTHHLWTQFRACGWCAVWNGFERGGNPAFVDVHGSMLHPLVAISTLAFGVVNGAKAALAASFWFAGLAQWWLARVLGVGRLARLWSALAAVAGGHLAGRMELGVFGVVLSTAMCSLVFAAALEVSRGGGRRAAILLGVVIASAALAGQGYIQIGLLGTLPAFVLLVFDKSLRPRPVWREYALAGLIAFLLAAPFLVPLVHFLPNFAKATDLQFSSAQPLAFLPLNLVIDDIGYYWSDALHKLPYPHLYSLFIGWLPVSLAVVGLVYARAKERTWALFLAACVLLEFLVASAILLKWVAAVIPSVGGIRHPPQIAGLAVPPILGLAAYGLDRLLRLDWPELRVQLGGSLNINMPPISMQWVLLIPLAFGLRDSYRFSSAWLFNARIGDGTYELLDGLKTPDLQWVQPPFGEHQFIQPAVEMGLKLSPGIMTWSWEGRPPPTPVFEANRIGPPPGPYQQIAELDGVPIYAHDGAPYAAVVQGGSKHACTATGSGGVIEVRCDTTTSGELIVQDNAFSGWKGWRDGERVELLNNVRLAVEAPAGTHKYLFKYLPWDVPLGLLLFGVGVVACAVMWIRAAPRSDTTSRP